jgi:predicted transcriptional regulator
MVRRRRSKAQHQLTEVELELMSILWARGGGTVRDVLAALPANRNLAYTSVSTMLRILEQKGSLASKKNGQSHTYVPRLSREDYEASALRQFVSTVFDNTPRALVARLIDGDQLSEEDLVQIRRLVDERLPGRRAAASEADG